MLSIYLLNPSAAHLGRALPFLQHLFSLDIHYPFTNDTTHLPIYLPVVPDPSCLISPFSSRRHRLASTPSLPDCKYTTPSRRLVGMDADERQLHQQ